MGSPLHNVCAATCQTTCLSVSHLLLYVADRPGSLTPGSVVKRGGRLLDIDLPTLRTRPVESSDGIATVAGVPLDGTWRPGTDSDGPKGHPSASQTPSH